jgi:uncharacterized protein (TIGR03067 family)
MTCIPDGTFPATFLIFAALSATGARAADAPQSAADALERLEGTWLLVYAETDGCISPADRVRPVRVEIHGTTYSVYFGDDRIAHDVSFAIDPKASPKTTDDTINGGPDKGKHVRGIYELDGDSLISCVGKAGQDRPKVFDTEKGQGHTLRVFSRTMPGDEARKNAVRDELIRFSGTWRFVSMDFGGNALDERRIGDSRLIIRGNRFVSRSSRGSVPGTFRIDPTSKPKTIDVVFSSTSGNSGTLHGIYELTDDTYKVCLGLDGMPRPSEFASKPGSGSGLQVLKRVVLPPP